jgi:D-hydroxyproline dehydrogenase subunit gamma
MFLKPPEAIRKTVTVLVEGQPVSVNAGDSAAAAALLAGMGSTRSSGVSGEPRAPYCMMGVCFECLMVIDGVASRQACMVPVREGMQIARQDGRRGFGS